MSSYLGVIRTAVLFFPLVAAAITLPFLIHHYRKFGSVTFLRFFLAYSFVLYLLCAYCLVILPLPDREEVARLTGPSVQPLPFSFFRDLPKETDFSLGDPSTYLPALTSNFTLQFVFNLALLFPLGFYLRYYFRKKALFTGVACFLTSLFFELTQLSGLYGVYPRPYRLFDVDDLICNTLGGLLGYWATGLLLRVLPDRERIDERAYEKGERVTFPRRLLAFCVDMVVTGLLSALVAVPLSLTPAPRSWDFPAAYLLYFGFFQWLGRGRTLGKALTRVRLADRDGSQVTLWRCLLRYGIVVAALGLLSLLQDVLAAASEVTGAWVYLFLLAGTWALLAFLFLLETVLNRSSGRRDYLHGRLSGTCLESTVVPGRAPQTGRKRKKEG